jgi:two-component system, OmpR family, catabolic regulation response regulator CreB
VKPKVLVVEDERAVADAVVYALTTDGCVALRAETGERARAILRDEDVALVVLDVGLPDVNGLDLCREIRAERELPIIFLTARAEEVDRVAGLEIGADDYVTKPFSPRELSARVRAVLRRAGPREPAGPAQGAHPPPSAGRALPFEIDAPRRAIRYFGQALRLTATEYRLLELLARHPGRVYSRDELLARLWDDPGATTDRSVDSHVKALRAKLRAVRAEPEAIETRRGEGYALRESW